MMWEKIGEAALTGLCGACMVGVFIVSLVIVIGALGMVFNGIKRLLGVRDED